MPTGGPLRGGCRKSPLPVAVLAVAFALLLAGCLGGRRAPAVSQFVLEYPSPAFPGLAQVEASIMVDRFAASAPFGTTAMVYAPAPYRMDTYNYERWMSEPAGMVTDHLYRDLLYSGLFRAVFGYQSAEGTRYEVSGTVEKFFEEEGPEGAKAVIALNVTFLDTSGRGFAGRVLFQKRYEAAEPLAEESPGDLAAAMSKAMQGLSARIIRDIYEAASKEGQSSGK